MLCGRDSGSAATEERQRAENHAEAGFLMREVHGAKDEIQALATWLRGDAGDSGFTASFCPASPFEAPRRVTHDEIETFRTGFGCERGFPVSGLFNRTRVTDEEGFADERLKLERMWRLWIGVEFECRQIEAESGNPYGCLTDVYPVQLLIQSRTNQIAGRRLATCALRHQSSERFD